MTSTIPCPNPACSAMFTRESIQGAKSFRCPRCQMIFSIGDLGQSSPGNPPGGQNNPPAKTEVTNKIDRTKPPIPPAPTQRVSIPPPLPKKNLQPAPIQPSPIPEALPVPGDEMSTNLTENTGNALVFEQPPHVVDSLSVKKRSTRKQKNQRFPVLLTLLGLILSGGLGFGIIWFIKNMQENSGPEGTNILETELANFRLSLPGSGWTTNNKTNLGLGVNLALSRKQDQMAFGYKDYKQRNPSIAELQDMVISKLTRFLKNRLEYEKRDPQGFSLGNQPASLLLDFEGVNAEGIPVAGQCIGLAYQGFGYWLFTWCPQEYKESYPEEWARIRGGFTFLDNRSGWKESEPEKETLGLTEAPFEVRYIKSIWKPQSPENWDPKAVAVLLGHDPTETRHAGKAASVQILLLDARTSLKGAAEAAQEYFKQRQKEEGYPETVLSPITNKETTDKETLGKLTLSIQKFHVINSETRERYVILASLPAKERNLVIVCDCDHARNSYWDIEFMNLLRSIRPR